MFGEVDNSGIEALERSFTECFIGHARIERLWTGARWSEGPAWFAAGRYLVWSDIPNNRLLRWDDCSNAVSVFRQPSNNSNGNTVDHQGRLITCEHQSRRVTRTEFDGSITVLADSYSGKRLNSPNDVVVKSDGSIWFTDPTYGIVSDYEGDKADSELPSNIYRISSSGNLSIVADDFIQPNGLAFSLDESMLYVSDTGVPEQGESPRHIRALEVTPYGKGLTNSREFAVCTNGVFDGFRFDRDGRLWTSAGDGVHCYSAEGELIGKIRLPEAVANICFGGPKLNRLLICGTTSLYSIYLAINGLSPYAGTSA